MRRARASIACWAAALALALSPAPCPAADTALPALPAFPRLPEPPAALEAGQMGLIHFATHSPYDLDVLLAGSNPVTTPTTGMGTLFLPTGASARAPVAAMVVLHGSGGITPGREMTYGRLLADHGFAAFVVDYYTPRGVTRETPYMAKVHAATEWDLIADAFAALRILGTHPDIDAKRVGVMGFSYGGMAVRMSLDERFGRVLAPDLAPFAVHVDYYGPCHFDLRTRRTTGAPLLTLRGAQDASNDLVACARTEATLRAGGSAVDAIVFATAGHAWEALRPRSMNASPYLAGCSIQYDEDGHPSLDGAPLPYAPPGATREQRYALRASDAANYGACLHRGYIVGRDDETRRRSDRILIDWLRTHL
jgi:dienelactone hydrolase